MMPKVVFKTASPVAPPAPLTPSVEPKPAKKQPRMFKAPQPKPRKVYDVAFFKFTDEEGIKAYITEKTTKGFIFANLTKLDQIEKIMLVMYEEVPVTPEN